MINIRTAISQTSPLTRGFAAILFATVIFFPVYWTVPMLWKSYVVTTGSQFSVGLFNALGFGGLMGIGISIILLKCDVFKNNDNHPVFLLINTIGAFLHLLSFTYYYNPFGISLDALYGVFGVWGWVRCKAWKNDWKLEKNSTRLISKIALVLLIFLVIVWFTWPSIQGWAKGINFPFHDVGFSAGILILAAFIGLVMGWFNPHGNLYAVIYMAGCVGYITNLMLEFNPFTVALESSMIWFFAFPMKKVKI